MMYDIVNVIETCQSMKSALISGPAIVVRFFCEPPRKTAHQCVFHAIRQGLPAGLDDIRTGPDGSPGAFAVTEIGEYAGDRCGSLPCIDDAYLVVGEADALQFRVIPAEDLVQGLRQGIHRTIALGDSEVNFSTDSQLDRGFG